MNNKKIVMKSFDKFYIKKPEFDIDTLILKLNYSFDNEINFTEIIDFNCENFSKINNSDPEIIENIIFNIGIAFGISYYKAFPTKEIIVESGNLDQYQSDFWKNFYKQGMGEFLFKNKISPEGLFNFIGTGEIIRSDLDWNLEEKAIIPIGGGKDSCVSTEKIRESLIDFDLFTFSSKDNDIFKDIEIASGAKRLLVKRQISPELFKLNEQGYYNGHIPITGLISFVLILTAYLYQYKYIVFSNEHSANYGNLDYEGMEVNHQYSKSLEFENDLRDYIKRYLSSDLEYFSILRGYYEVKIVKEFSKLKKYFPIFTSCNGNFKVIKKSINKRWCLDCPKCGFVFACVHPYLNEQELIEIFGENMYEDKNQEVLFEELLGISGHKPFECVGTNEEVILSMWYSYNKVQDKQKLSFILKIFEEKIIPNMTKEDFKKLEEKLLKDYENNIPEILNKINFT